MRPPKRGTGRSSPVRSLEARLRRLEDLAAIGQVIAAYGPAADSVNLNVLARLWAEDALYVTDNGEASGRERILQAYGKPFHQGLLANGCAHTATPPYVVLEGDHAVATNYGVVFSLGDTGSYGVARVVASRWLLGRTATGDWEVLRRDLRPIGPNSAARDLLVQFDTTPAPDVTTTGRG